MTREYGAINHNVRRQQAYHGGLGDGAKAVDENVASDIYRRTCEK